MIELTSEQVRSFFALAATRMTEEKDALCELDAQAGDGDIGLTMSKGFSAVREALQSDPSVDDIRSLFRTAAMTMMNAAPSTMGTLIASGLLRISTSAPGGSESKTISVVTLLDGLLEGIQTRGKSQPGDKTILDVLAPSRAAAETGDATELTRVAEEAARNTATMRSVHGRASRYPDGSEGKVDPGAVVGAHLVTCLVEAYRQ